MKQEWRFYGRRMGRKLNASRQILLDEFLPKLEIPKTQIQKQADLPPSSLFSFTPKKNVLEIGFGNGEHLAEMMRQQPETGFIGAEPFINGMTAFMKEIHDEGMGKNIRVHMDDAIPLVKSLAPNTIDEIYVLNPDPWHKLRHHQRRIINQDNLDLFAKILKPKGKLIMSTDVRDLIEWMVTEATLNKNFKWTAQNCHGWQVPPADWIPTRYETKGAKGADKMNYLFFERSI